MRLSHPHRSSHLRLRRGRADFGRVPRWVSLDVGVAGSSPAPAPNSGAPATQASPLPAVPGPCCVLPRAPMAGKLLSLLPPLLLAAVGLAGLLLLCVPTQDVREPPSLKVHAPTAPALV